MTFDKHHINGGNMQRNLSRSALVACCVSAAAAFSAAPALAAVTAVNLPATSVTAGSAVLNGIVTTGGKVTQWEFSYNLVSNPFAGGFTTGAIIPAGATGNTPVSDVATGLTPSTAYTFALVAADVTFGANYYLLSPVYGAPALTFKTRGPGSASLTSKKLKVKGGRVAVGIKCTKAFACDGGVLAITARHKGKKVACGSATFNVAAGRTKTVKTSKVSATCKALLTLAKKHKISAHLAAGFTYQKGISKGVTLTQVK
jgi:hypothetical protein